MGIGFYAAEKRAKDPILDIGFFKYPSFAFGSIIIFLVSFSIFALFTYAPLFLQGGLALSPLQVGYAMLSLSLGWSMGSCEWRFSGVYHRVCGFADQLRADDLFT